MAVRIRLKRFGRKKRPTYRIVVAPSTAPRDGKVLEEIGRYEPLAEPPVIEINEERAKYWLSVGAQPTETIERLLASQGITEKVDRQAGSQGVSRKDRAAATAEG